MAPHLALRLACAPILGLALAPLARAQCPDEYEPNDSCGQAANVPANSMLNLGLAFPSNPTGSDPDFFHVAVPPGETFEVRIDAFAPPVFDVEVYDAPTCSQPIASGTLFDPPLRIANPGPAPLELWIGVLPAPNGTESPCEFYQLILRTFVDSCAALTPDAFEPNDDLPSAAPIPPGSYANLNVQGGSADYYRIPAPHGSLVALTMTQHLHEYPGANPTVVFIDANTGQALQGGYAEGVTNYVNLTGNPEVGLLVRLDTRLTCSSYDMTIEVSGTPCDGLADDAFEENDSCANASPLLPGDYPGLNATYTDADFYRVELTPGHTMVAVIEYDPAFASGVRSQVYGGCNINDWYPVYKRPGRLTALVKDDGVGSSSYTLTAGIDGQELDPDAPCAEYDLSLRTYSHTIGTTYCPALPNSSGAVAQIEAYGSTSVANGELALLATHLPAFAPGILFFGPNQVQLPLGNGLRCVGGGTTRLKPVQFAGIRAYIFHVVDFDSVTAQLLAPGSTYHFQAWFRDGSSSNLSNAVTLTFQ